MVYNMLVANACAGIRRKQRSCCQHKTFSLIPRLWAQTSVSKHSKLSSTLLLFLTLTAHPFRPWNSAGLSMLSLCNTVSTHGHAILHLRNSIAADLAAHAVKKGAPKRYVFLLQE